MNIEKRNKRLIIKKINTELIIKGTIILLLICLTIITSFNAGKKFFLLKNTLVDNKKVEYECKVARWNFNTEIKVITEENNLNEDNL